MLKISQNKLFLFLLCIFIALVLVIFHFVGILRPVENIILKISSPAAKMFYSMGDKIKDSFSFLTSIRDLSKENRSLSLELERSSVDKARLEELKKENEKLREQLYYKKKSQFELIPSMVISKDPSSLLRVVNINKGSKNGVEEEDLVVVSEGILIGKISEVYDDFSKVLLIIDINSRVQAKIQDSNADGVISGEHGLGLIMDLIPQDKVVKKGDVVVTSDVEQDSQALLIGEVEEVKNSDNELFQKARIKSPVDFKDLKHTFVVKSKDK